MRILRTGKFGRTMARWLLAASLFLPPVACSRTEAGDQAAPAPNPAPSAQRLATVTTPAAPSQPNGDGLAAFAQAVASKFDRSHMTTRPAGPAGGILHIPNGYAAHATILVRNPDGTLRSACVSSPAEVSALVKQVRNGADQ